MTMKGTRIGVKRQAIFHYLDDRASQVRLEKGGILISLSLLSNSKRRTRTITSITGGFRSESQGDSRRLRRFSAYFILFSFRVERNSWLIDLAASSDNRLYNGNLVLDCPVPSKLLDMCAQRNEREYTHMRYTAATCDPNNFKVGFLICSPFEVFAISDISDFVISASAE